jgi:hypothetical protein
MVGVLLAVVGVVGGVTQLTSRQAEKPNAVVTQTIGSGPLAAPAGAPVLRIDGVAHGNVAAGVTKLDFKTLDGLARESLTVDEPFLKRKITFTGVRLGSLMRRLGVPASTRSLYMHALDDYHVVLPFAALSEDALLATRAGGRPIPVADGGPIRVVFPDGSKLGAVTDNWIWSLDRVTPK